MESETGNDINLPLSGIRVLELGQLIAGPYAGQMLAAFGADVVKIEPPDRGDPLRTWRKLDAQGTSYWWRSIARNKKSVTLDLGHADARDLASRLIMKCDVVIENFKPGRMEAWGLGPEKFRNSHPDLIYTRVSGYGQTGPYSHKAGFASACEAVAGLRYVNGYAGEKPVRMNLSLGDTLAGMHATIGVLLALIARQSSSQRGQSIDVSIVESVFNMLEGVLPEFDGTGEIRQPSGSTVTGIVPTNTYRCSDGRFIVIGGNGDSIFKRLMTVIGRKDMADDAELSSNQGRVAHEKKIDEALSTWCLSIHSGQALLLLDSAMVPAGPVNSIADIAADPHFNARGAFENVQVNNENRVLPAVHPKLSDTPALTRWAGPELGEHTQEVFRNWLGVDEQQIEQWRAQKLI